MAKRSLQASNEGIRKAKQAFKRKGWTQEYLATEVGLDTRQPIWKFFTGKAVDRQVFHEICLVLEINANEIIEKDISKSPFSEIHPKSQIKDELSADNLDSIVFELRSLLSAKTQDRCETLRLLDVAHPLQLEDIYVDVNIQEGATSNCWLEINNLDNSDFHDLGNLCLKKSQNQVFSGLEVISKYPKMMILGKPGSGKTTFLQSIAISCNRGQTKSEYVPIFIRLKDFIAEVKKDQNIDLFNYINHLYKIKGLDQAKLIQILLNGRAIIMLDALDEVSEEFVDLITSKICDFTDNFYQNQIIISSRTASKYYQFRSFTEVEISDFNTDQIAAFIYKWFLTVGKTSFIEGKVLAQRFMHKLQLPENQKIRELATTPLLLNIICLVFYTLGDFPNIRSELYRRSLELLLSRWDEARGIKRDTIYRDLSFLHKIKLLSHIAATTFNEDSYFFSEVKLQQIISNYISNQLPRSQSDIDGLLLDSSIILKAIESQHGLLVKRAQGIYSFSHLTFYEYFTAKEIVANDSLETLQKLITHIYDQRWREVFILVVSMLPSADIFIQLIQAEVYKLVLYNQKLHNFLTWVNQKSSLIKSSHHPAAIRSFYFNLALPAKHKLSNDQNLALSLDPNIAVELDISLNLDMALNHAISVSLGVNYQIFPQRISAIHLALEIDDLLINKSTLRAKIRDLKEQLPTPYQPKDILIAWWKANGDNWHTKLRNAIIEESQIGNNWQFSQNDYKVLQQYWEGNKLLLDCLRSSVNISKDLRRSLEQNLFTLEDTMVSNFEINVNQ